MLSDSLFLYFVVILMPDYVIKHQSKTAFQFQESAEVKLFPASRNGPGTTSQDPA